MGKKRGVPIGFATTKLRPPREPKRRQKFNYLGVPATFKLDLACMNLYQAFCLAEKFGGIYMVGSVLERPDFRDVDVVCILHDDDFAALFPDVQHHTDPLCAHFEMDPRWLILTVALSDWLSGQIGHPVDFKFQPMTFANGAHHRKCRHPLGLRTVARRLQNDTQQ